MMNTDKIFAEAIANEYAPKDTSKVVALRKLDWKAKRPATVFAYSFGIGAALILGLGMCLSMQVIGGGGVLMTGAGILLGILGIVGVALAAHGYGAVAVYRNGTGGGRVCHVGRHGVGAAESDGNALAVRKGKLCDA